MTVSLSPESNSSTGKKNLNDLLERNELIVLMLKICRLDAETYVPVVDMIEMATNVFKEL